MGKGKERKGKERKGKERKGKGGKDGRREGKREGRKGRRGKDGEEARCTSGVVQCYCQSWYWCSAAGAGRSWEKEQGLESGRGVATTLLVVSVSCLVLTPVLRAAFALGSWELGFWYWCWCLGQG